MCAPARFATSKLQVTQLDSSSPSFPLQRMYRMRAWRQSLSREEREQWVTSGAAGPGLRDYSGPQCSPELERELLHRQPEGEAARGVLCTIASL